MMEFDLKETLTKLMNDPELFEVTLKLNGRRAIFLSCIRRMKYRDQIPGRTDGDARIWRNEATYI